MKDQKTEKISILIIFIFVLLMMAFVFVQITAFDLFKTSEKINFQELSDDSLEKNRAVEAARGMFIGLGSDFKHPNFIDQSVPRRMLKSFYSLRAYNGAPPVIPHPVLKKNTLTGDTCLGCHLHGGFTPKFNAYAPVTPHPEKTSCRQCHNPIKDISLFKTSNWVKNTGKRGIAHLPGAPLVIPHSLHMRENCLACHSGPAAVKEIRTTHPERINCLQCHVEKKTAKVWEKR
ncbi:MAG: hypothetical protein OXB84_05000 [Halobacteriovoraceae bacterium]|nr:hypothetical protein [Halobacteriovoraceae bacterium]